jgi:P27 family predicted phage terminase small subunit
VVKGNAVARDEWERVTIELGGKRIIAKVDGAALTAYCMAYARWIQAEEIIQREGAAIQSSQGLKKHSVVTVAASYRPQMRPCEAGYMPLRCPRTIRWTPL